jgi:CRP/FNR family transcriptional regulator, cyclic AMP receptor protein
MNGETNRDFNPQGFLSTIGDGRQIVSYREKQTIFAQGDATDAVFVIQKGKIKLSAKSRTGREATLGILTGNDFVGEDGIAGQPLRIASAIALTDCDLLRIDQKVMVLSLHQEQSLLELFVAHLLERNIRYQEDLIDQRCSFSEKRLVRVLLLLAKKNTSDSAVPKLDQTTLAQMVGTTRSRISFFMNRFRSLGLIDYGDCSRGWHIHRSLLARYAKKRALSLAQS